MADTIKNTVNNVLETLHITSKSSEMNMREPTKEEVELYKAKYKKAGQDQVFTFYNDLNINEKALLFQQLKRIDPEYINQITTKALTTNNHDEKKDEDKIETLPASSTSSIYDASQPDIDNWYNNGLKLISENKVAVVLMAGGQGTRLGSSEPKGCYDIGLPSHKSLFQLQAERIWKIQKLASKKYNKETVTIPWYIMTSGPTRKPTEEFFIKNNYFGLNKSNIIFFEQGTLPCISNDGKILLENKHKISVAPDGNGGLYQALITGGIIQDMTERNIDHIHAYCVDNCLVKVADPVFIGFSSAKKVSIATKVVRKRDATESVGLIISKNGKPDVIEYSEISKEMTEEKDGENKELLKFRSANIVNHYYSFEFLKSIPIWSSKLPHHIARKKIPYIDTKTGQVIKPEKPNGIKLEQFVFDCFQFLEMDKFACFEVKRETDYSPLKNAKGTGQDDPDTSRKDIFNQGKAWIEAVDGIITSEDINSDEGVEISPKISYVSRSPYFS